MHDQPTHSPAAKSKSNHDATSFEASRKAADYSSHKSSSYEAHRKRDPITASDERLSATDSSSSSRKRPASTSSDNSKKKLSTSDVKRSNYDEKPIRSPDRDSLKRRSTEPNRDVRRTPSGSSSGYPAKQHVSRADNSRASDKTGMFGQELETYLVERIPCVESSHRSSSATNRFSDRPSGRSERPPTHATDTSRTRAPSPFGSRGHSSEKRPTSSSSRSDHHRSSSIDKSRQRSSTHSSTNKYDPLREPTVCNSLQRTSMSQCDISLSSRGTLTDRPRRVPTTAIVVQPTRVNTVCGRRRKSSLISNTCNSRKKRRSRNRNGVWPKSVNASDVNSKVRHRIAPIVTYPPPPRSFD